MNINKKINQKYLGICCIILAAFCFASMSLFIRLTGERIPTFEKSFFRNLVAIFFAVIIIRREKLSFSTMPKHSMKYLWARAIGGTIGIFCNFYAVDHMMIADANLLNKLSPFFAILFSYFLLKEKIRPYQMLCILLAFFGAVLILRPGSAAISVFPAVIGILGGCGAGFAYTNVRKASSVGVAGPLIVLFFSVFSCIASLPLMLPVFQLPNARELIFLLLTGLAATGGQFAVTAAYAHAPAREISIYDYTQILFASLFGVLLFGEVPDLFSILGFITILTASAIMFFIQRKNFRSAA